MEELKFDHPKGDEHKSEKKHKSTLTETFRKNPWIVSTLVLGIFTLILLIGLFGNYSLSGKVVSGDKVADKLLKFYEANGATGLELESVEKVSGVYQINFLYKGSSVPIFATRDGAFAGSLAPIVDPSEIEEPKPTTVPKSDSPKVELFVWGYCPYGVQAQGPLADVANLLKENANFEIVPYYDGHGAYETQQNKIQLCVQKLEKDKYWDYASGFVENIYPKCSVTRDIECDKTESTALMKSLGINSDAVWSCVDSEGDNLFSQAANRSKELGVTGSPTLVVNDVITNPSSRTAESFKSIVCGAFNNAPASCSQILDSTAATASGNC